MEHGWTRAEVSAMLGVPATTLRTWERAGAGRPSMAGTFQSPREARYSVADVLMLQVVAHAHRIGMNGSALAGVWNSMKRVRSYLTKDWSGIIVTTSAPDAYLIGSGQIGPEDVDSVVLNLPQGVDVRTVTFVKAPAGT